MRRTHDKCLQICWLLLLLLRWAPVCHCSETNSPSLAAFSDAVAENLLLLSKTRVNRPRRREVSVGVLDRDPYDPLADKYTNSGSNDFNTQGRSRLQSRQRPEMNHWLDLARKEINDGDEQQQQQVNDTMLRNAAKNFLLKKTGTTIVGLVVGGDVCILAADTRATAGSMVADRRADKLHRLGRYASAAGAGTSADLEHLTRECYFVQKLQARLRQVGNDNSNSPDDDDDDDASDSSVLSICHFLQARLLEQGGGCQANLILGGVDPFTGQAHLRALHPHGSVDTLQYAALGSGGLAAMSVLESRYPQLCQSGSVEDGIQLAIDAVRAGIINDLGSGSQVDLCVITAKDGCQYTRSVVAEEILPAHNIVESSDASLAPASSVAGVNGFGNLPYSVRSTRQVRVSLDQENSRKLEDWNDILGNR